MAPPASLPQVVVQVAEFIQHLEPGPLAELRRLDAGRPAPAFWRLAVRYPNSVGAPSRQASWISIVRIIATLMPKGDPAQRPRLHDPRRRLGEVLCDGGDPAWPGGNADARPVYSEARFNRLLAARGRHREILMERAARTIARSRQPDSGVNLVDVAYTLFRPTDRRWLAESYYRRLDRAERTHEDHRKEEEIE